MNKPPYLSTAEELLSGKAELNTLPSDGTWGHDGVDMSSQLEKGNIPDSYNHAEQINLYHRQQASINTSNLPLFSQAVTERTYIPFQNRRATCIRRPLFLR